MPVVELPVNYPSSVAGGSFVQGNHALRSNWCDSFYLPADPQNGHVLYGGSGAVNAEGTFGSILIQAGGVSPNGIPGRLYFR